VRRRCGANPGLLAIASRPARQKAARRRCKRGALAQQRYDFQAVCPADVRTPPYPHQLFPTRGRSRYLGSSTPPFYLHTNSIDSRIHRIVLIYTLDRDTYPWRKPCSSLRHFIVWDTTPPPTFRLAGRSHPEAPANQGLCQSGQAPGTYIPHIQD